MQVLKLSYYDDFRCAGGDCPETCCGRWSIIFSRNEYLKLVASNCSEKLKAATENSFVKIDGGDNINYAVIKLDEHGLCPLLDENGLCTIQKELGESFLPYTCSVFPRYETAVGDECYLCGCQITCPHVVEMLMSYPDGISVIKSEYSGDNPRLNMGLYTVPAIPKLYEKIYPEIEETEIKLLQNRSFTISERLLTVGFYCQKINDCINKKEEHKIHGISETLSEKEMCKKIAASLSPSQTEESRAAKTMELIGKMCLFASEEGSLSNGVKSLFQQVADCLELQIRRLDDSNIYIDWNEKQYFKNAALYQAIEKEAGFLIENVLVNLIFTTSPSGGVWANYFTMAVFYGVMRICLPAFLEEDWQDKDLAAAISKTAKMLLNSSVIKKSVILDFVEKREFTLPYAAFLVG